MTDRTEALALLLKYNQDRFHIQHALTVEGVMRYFAVRYGYADEADFWATAGLLHDIDFEKYPAEHCRAASGLLSEIDASDGLVHAVCSHGWQLTVDIEPVHFMEKVLYAVDELTGLVWATAIMRPSRSTSDLEVKSVKKKFKTKGFAAGCSREVIERGAGLLGWELERLIAETIEAMRSGETAVFNELDRLITSVGTP